MINEIKEKMKIKHVFCKTCHKRLGRVIVKHETYKVKEGTIQIGQGMNKPLISFCSRRCLDIYKSSELSEMEKQT